MFLNVSDRGNQETAEQGLKRADQQDETGAAELCHVPEGGVSAADARSSSHPGAGLQKPAGRCGPGSSQSKSGQAQTRFPRSRNSR